MNNLNIGGMATVTQDGMTEQHDWHVKCMYAMLEGYYSDHNAVPPYGDCARMRAWTEGRKKFNRVHHWVRPEETMDDDNALEEDF